MNVFYASFIPGLKEIIAEVIKERLKNEVKIIKLLDGGVLFETMTSYDKLNFFCFNNIFAVISIMKQHEKNGALERHIEAAINEKEINREVISHNNAKFRTFRLVTSVENVPCSVKDEKLRLKAENFISCISKLKVNRASADTEFWFLFRNEKDEKFSLFMKRLTIRPSWEKTLHKGELPPPLAWVLCRLARLAHTDTVLDPFCGYGSIPAAALKYFHINKFIACDINKEAFLYSKNKLKKHITAVNENGKLNLMQKDFFLLSSIAEKESIDAIITDPPWGHYKETEGDFNEKIFTAFFTLLKKEGRAVVLCANTESAETSYEGFLHEKSIPILLSGKKVLIQLFIKN